MRRRDERAAEFEAFFHAAFESLWNSVTLVCGDRERARDAVQEAFIKAYGHWSRIRQYDDPAAWVRRVAIHASHDAGRSDLRRRRREQRVVDRDHEPSVNADVTAGESAVHLLDALPGRQRAVAALFYFDDLSTAEIATTLDIAEGTVRFHLAAARERLRTLHPRIGDHVV